MTATPQSLWADKDKQITAFVALNHLRFVSFCFNRRKKEKCCLTERSWTYWNTHASTVTCSSQAPVTPEELPGSLKFTDGCSCWPLSPANIRPPQLDSQNKLQTDGCWSVSMNNISILRPPVLTNTPSNCEMFQLEQEVGRFQDLWIVGLFQPWSTTWVDQSFHDSNWNLRKV